MSVTSLDYGRIADLLIQQLAIDGHSLDNIPQAVFHIQAHGSDNNTLRLTHPGIPLFPTRALAIVGYNTYGVMSYCKRDFNERVTIFDKDGKPYSIPIFIKSTGDEEVAIKLPQGETISEEMGKKIGLRDNDIQRINGGETILIPIGHDGGKISIEFALLIATTIYYSFVDELKSKLGANMFDDGHIRRTLLELHKRMYYNCGIRDFPNCMNRDVPGLYKDIYYVYEKSYALYENSDENTVCEITTQQGTYMNVRTPTQISPYGLYIMYSTLKYLIPTKVPKTLIENNIVKKIRRLYEGLFGSMTQPEGVEDICISQSNIMYNGSNMVGTFDGKLPELFYNIIKLRLESELFRTLIPDRVIRDQIAAYWLILANLDTPKSIPFSYLQFYLSYILLLDVSIIDGSCRSSSTKSALISPKFPTRVIKKSRKAPNAISNVRTLLQNKTADIISTVTTDIINKRISDFRNSSQEEKLTGVTKWINIFDKGSFQEMMDSLRSPWFNYPPISTEPSLLNTFATSAMNPKETRKAIKKSEQHEREQELYERQQEFLHSIEEELSTRINKFLQGSGLEERYPDIKKEIVDIIVNMSFLEPSAISDEEIHRIIENIITTDSQIAQEENERARVLVEKARIQQQKAIMTNDEEDIDKFQELASEADAAAQRALTLSRTLSTKLGKLESQNLTLKVHRGRRDSENVDDSVKSRKSMKVRSNSGEMSTKGGAIYNLKRKTIRCKKGRRGQKITKNKRKLKRKQY